MERREERERREKEAQEERGERERQPKSCNEPRQTSTPTNCVTLRPEPCKGTYGIKVHASRAAGSGCAGVDSRHSTQQHPV